MRSLLEDKGRLAVVLEAEINRVQEQSVSR